MTKGKQIAMLESWAKRFNPKAELFLADRRCGELYAVGITDSKGLPHTFTDYLTPAELEQFLMGVFHAKEFIKEITETARQQGEYS